MDKIIIVTVPNLILTTFCHSSQEVTYQVRKRRRGFGKITILPIKSIMKDVRVNSEEEVHSLTSRNVSTIRQSKQLCMFNCHKYSSPFQHGELVFLSSYFHMTYLPMLCLKLNIISLDSDVFLTTLLN